MSVKMCEECGEKEAVHAKQTYGHYVFMCDDCYNGERTHIEEDLKKYETLNYPKS